MGSCAPLSWPEAAAIAALAIALVASEVLHLRASRAHRSPSGDPRP